MSRSFTPPREFDGYRLEEKIGQGGMGQVWRAHDTVLDRAVAVKFIVPLYDDMNAHERFFVEARAIARLQHPNVVTIHRVGEVDGLPYLVSEFVRGEGLDRIHVPVPWQRALEIGMGLARGLATAHRRGVLHRDIKPANVLLTEDGDVKLLDFGLAKLLDARSASMHESLGGETRRLDIRVVDGQFDDGAITTPGVVMGTPQYMAPEVWRAEPATRRTDVYSLGALLYYLCAGRPPHEAADLRELGRVVQIDDAQPVAAAAPGVDARFAAIVDRCLRRDPRDRFSDGNEVRAALSQLTPTARSGAVPEGNPYRGLHAFEGAHRALYFGRDAEIAALLKRLASDPFVLVAGDSGVGKSSLCRAGVLPRVADGVLGGDRAWTLVTFVPGKHPLTALSAALAPHLEVSEEGLARRILDEPAALGRDIRQRRGPGAGVLVFIDQLEELITLSDPREADVVAHVLGWLATPTPGIRLLASVRGDFLSRLAALPGIGGELSRALYFVRPLSPERIREAIAGPAHVKGVAFESDAMVDALVAATATDEGGLPLLQFALAELWEARDGERQVIPSSALDALGGVAGALTRHADDVLAALRPGQRAAARRILTSLVTSRGTRARRVETELTAGDPEARAALDALVRARLLVAREDKEGSAYEVAHEVLIRSWATLRGWLDEDAEERAVRERLAAAVVEWQRLGRTSEVLWSARQLDEASRVDRASLAATERAFLAGSRSALRRRRLVRFAVATAVPVAFLVAWGAVWFQARQDLRRRIATHVAAADAAVDGARARGREAARARGESFARFDAQDRAAGEAAWSRAVAIDAESAAEFARASHALEAALSLDARRADVRARMGDLLLELLVARDRATHGDPRDPERAGLLERLALYDERGERRRHFDAPARLVLAATPPATAHVARFVDGRAQEPARALGATPLEARLESGSFLVTLAAPGHADARLPIVLARGEEARLAVELPPAGQIPDGFVFVPPGAFLFGGAGDDGLRRDFFNTVPLHQVRTGGYLIARRETTFGEWIEFLRALPDDERVRRLPRVGKGGFAGGLSLDEEGGGFRLTFQPAGERFTARDGERVVYPARAWRAAQDWLRFPVVGIAADDAEAYAAWLDRSGRVPGARLCSELEWERAARGADGRAYPHGATLDADDANWDATYARGSLAMGPDEVGSHPTSRSPFGVDDLAGNAWEWTTSTLAPGEYVARGGSHAFGANSCRSANREVTEPTLRDLTLGLRVCATIGQDRHASSAALQADSARTTGGSR